MSSSLRVVPWPGRRTTGLVVASPAQGAGFPASWTRRSSRRVTKKEMDPPVKPAGNEGREWRRMTPPLHVIRRESGESSRRLGIPGAGDWPRFPLDPPVKPADDAGGPGSADQVGGRREGEPDPPVEPADDEERGHFVAGTGGVRGSHTGRTCAPHGLQAASRRPSSDSGGVPLRRRIASRASALLRGRETRAAEAPRRAQGTGRPGFPDIGEDEQ